MGARFYRKGGSLHPADDRAIRGLNRMTDGEVIDVEIIRPRSAQWHRMYFGICARIGENQEPARDAESIDAELRVHAGHYDVVPVEGVQGVEVRMPRRIAFKKLSAEKWAALWPSLELAIRQRFGEEYLARVAA
jgi:hypothetical protein